MSLRELFKSKRVLSFELFPPKTEKGEQNLYAHVEQLLQFKPDFITCTYGAGGSTQGKTLQIINNVKQKFGVPVASHLTLVDSTVDDLRAYLETAKQNAVDYIVALRGDPPEGKTSFEAYQGGLTYANELVELIDSEFKNFEMLVAGYPEMHQEAPNMEVDLENLKRKVDAGASAIVTQLFYDNADFYRFRDDCDRHGINVPIVAGLLPVTNLKQIQRITSLCGARLPQEFVAELSRDESVEAQFEAGVAQCIAQSEDLLANGVDGLHYYVLNKSAATKRILDAIDFSRETVKQE